MAAISRITHLLRIQLSRVQISPLGRLGALLLLAAASPGLTAGQRPTTGASLLVLSKQDHTLAIVDPQSLRVEARIPVGEDPHEVIASTDGSTAYVSNYGFGRYNTLAVIDLAARRPLAPIDLGPLYGPHGLAFVGGKVWFTAEAAKAIARYDPESGRVDWIMGTGQNRTHMIHVFPDARRIVTTNVNSGTVLVLDRIDAPGGAPRPGDPAVPGYPPGAILPPGGDWLPTVIAVGRRGEGFDVSPDGREAWIANAGDGTISIIDLRSKRVAATLRANVPGANRLRFTPDGRHVLVSLISSPDLVILDALRRTPVRRLPIGHGAAGILVEPGGGRAFVSCSPDNYVAVVDLVRLAVVGRIEAGGNPDGLAWAAVR